MGSEIQNNATRFQGKLSRPRLRVNQRGPWFRFVYYGRVNPQGILFLRLIGVRRART